jgi:hypothetical protein
MKLLRGARMEHVDVLDTTLSDAWGYSLSFRAVRERGEMQEARWGGSARAYIALACLVQFYSTLHTSWYRYAIK